MVTHCVANRLRLADRHRKFVSLVYPNHGARFRSSFTFAKIMQIERNTTSSLDCFAEMPLIFCKGSNFFSHIQCFAN